MTHEFWYHVRAISEIHVWYHDRAISEIHVWYHVWVIPEIHVWCHVTVISEIHVWYHVRGTLEIHHLWPSGASYYQFCAFHQGIFTLRTYHSPSSDYTSCGWRCWWWTLIHCLMAEGVRLLWVLTALPHHRRLILTTWTCNTLLLLWFGSLN